MNKKTSVERGGRRATSVFPGGDRDGNAARFAAGHGTGLHRGRRPAGIDRREAVDFRDDDLRGIKSSSRLARGIDVGPIGASSIGSTQSRSEVSPGSIVEHEGSTGIPIPGEGRVIVIMMISEKEGGCDGYAPSPAGRDSMRSIVIRGDRASPSVIQAVMEELENASAPTSELVETVARVLELSGLEQLSKSRCPQAADHFADLTPRQRQIMDLVIAGHPNKIIAADLGISQRTVESHRASIMKKTGAKSLPALVRLAMVAGRTGQSAPTSQH